jgi:hypothetical protein
MIGMARLKLLPATVALRRMKSRKTVHVDAYKHLPADEFWKRYDVGECKK